MKSWKGTLAVIVICGLLIIWIASGGNEFWK